MVDTERLELSSANVLAVPKYLVVKRKEGDFVKASPFLIKKAITGCAGSVVRTSEKPQLRPKRSTWY